MKSNWKYFVLCVLVILQCVMVGGLINNTVFITDCNGAIEKEQKLIILKGQILKLCCMAGENYTAQDIILQVDGKQLPTVIMNNTTIKFEKLQMQEHDSTQHYCHNNKSGRNAGKGVIVGLPPKNVTHFDCVSKYLEELKCSWNSSDIISTNYRLKFYVNDKLVYRRGCPNSKNNEPPRHCVWNLSSSPSYGNYNTKPEIKIELESENDVGINNETFFIHHAAIFKSKPPANLVMVNNTSHSIYIKWNIPDEIYFLDGDIEHKIEYEVMNDTHRFDIIKSNKRDKKWYEVNITDLPYAHMEYTIKISVKLVSADDKFWSDFGNRSLYTASEKPKKAPETTIGAFWQNEFTDYRFLNIYWRRLKIQEESGDNFGYIINVKQGKVSKTLNSSLGSLVVENATLEGIEVSIWSNNEMGRSEHYNTLYIPAVKETRSLAVKSLSNYVYENGTHELLWNKVDNVDSYTIFWCEDGTIDSCAGELGFHNIGSGIERHVIHLPNPIRYRFAISANRGYISSGMIWSRCNTLPGKIDTLPDMDWIGVDFKDDENFRRDTAIQLSWSINCILKWDIIRGFNITYDAPNHAELKYLYVDNTDQNEVNITNLLPHTNYTIALEISTEYGTKTVARRYIKTREGIPTAPENVRITHVSNDSITLWWNRPKELNGDPTHIRYKIFNSEHKVDTIQINETHYHYTNKMTSYNYTVNNLESYTNYSIGVQTCNIHSSICSNTVYVPKIRTRIGSGVKPLNVTFRNNLLSWNEPRTTGGPNFYYEIKVTKDNITQTYTTNELNKAIQACDNNTNLEEYVVRVVTVDQNNNKYEGEWSDKVTQNCKTVYDYYWMTLMGIVFTVVFVFIFLLIVFICIYCIKRYNMQKIKKNLHVPDFVETVKLNLNENQQERAFYEYIINKDPIIIPPQLASTESQKPNASSKIPKVESSSNSPNRNSTDTPLMPSTGKEGQPPNPPTNISPYVDLIPVSLKNRQLMVSPEQNNNWSNKDLISKQPNTSKEVIAPVPQLLHTEILTEVSSENCINTEENENKGTGDNVETTSEAHNNSTHYNNEQPSFNNTNEPTSNIAMVSSTKQQSNDKESTTKNRNRESEGILPVSNSDREVTAIQYISPKELLNRRAIKSETQFDTESKGLANSYEPNRQIISNPGFIQNEESSSQENEKEITDKHEVHPNLEEPLLVSDRNTNKKGKVKQVLDRRHCYEGYSTLVRKK